MKLRHRVLRWLGVVSPSGRYPLLPRWDMSKLGRERWYPQEEAARPSARPVRLPGTITPVAVRRGALTRFSGSADPQHECGWPCAGIDPSHPCFAQQPYVPKADR